MKRILLLVCALVVATATFAQKQQQLANMSKEYIAEKVVSFLATAPVVTPSNSAAAPAAIFSDDFSNPSNWVIDHDQTACSLDWELGTPSCQGSFPINTIVSTTASNGYAMIDSDFYGGATGGTEMEDCWLTMAQPVDLNGYPNIIVQFEAQYQSYNNEKAYIVVGVGDGSGNVIWPDLEASTNISAMNNVFEAFPGYANGDATTNPELMIVDISTALVGLSTVELADIYIRFHWTGTWGYAWFVDDFAIAETPDNAIVASSEVIGGFWIDYANYTGAGLNEIYGLDYSHTPLSQLSNHPFSFEASVKNTGLSVQHTVLKYDVTGAGSASGVSSTIVLNPQEDSLFAAMPTFGDANTAIGSYSVDIYAAADSAGAGVTITTLPAETTPFEVTNYIYGKDLGSLNPGWYRVGGPVTQNHLTTRYEMYANEQLYSLRIFISGRSAIGAEIKAIIYESDSTATDDVAFYDESDKYTITAQDTGKWVDIPFLSPISLLNGYAYDCGIVGFQNPTDSSFIGTSGKSMYNGEHLSFDELGLSSQSAGQPTWYYTTSTPMIRMNFDPASSTPQSFDCVGTSCVDPGTGAGTYSSFSICQNTCNPNGLEEKRSNISIYPNPSNGIFVIELDGTTKYDLTIYNVLGQTVFSTFTNTILTTIDLSSFDKGVYTVELKNKNAIYIEKVIVE
jgi:hypothetical protein